MTKQKFNTRKWSKLSFLSVIGMILIVNFQNCAPAPGQQAADQNDGTSLPVTTIDPLKTGPVVFEQKAVKVAQAAATVELNGSCSQSQSGAILYWELRDGDDQFLADGYADCDQGGFQVELAPAQELKCGEAYTLSASLGLHGKDQVEIKRDCGSLASVN